MELQTGLRLLVQQFISLFLKNFFLSWRNKRATFLLLFSPLFFMLLLFGIQKAIEARFSYTTVLKNVFDPEDTGPGPIPPCEERFFTKVPCFDFVWSGNGSQRFEGIVKGIMDNNPQRPIPSDKVKSFKTANEVDEWLLNNPMRCSGALHFIERNDTVISYGLQTNSTPVSKRGNFQDPTFMFQIPFQASVEREIARSLIGDPSFNWEVGFKEFAHPAVSVFSAVASAGPTFFFAVAMFGFTFQISALTIEKELKLRQAMTMMGLYDTAYWLSWLTWEAILTFLSSLLTVLFGMVFQFDFFLHNSFAIVFFLFFLFQLNMVGLAFIFSAIIEKASSATTLGFYIFIIGSMTQVATTFGFPYTHNYSKPLRYIWSLFPPNLLAEGLQLLSDATATHQDPGVSWRGRNKCAPNDIECVMNLNDVYTWLVFTFIVWVIIAIYLDNIIPNASGVRKSALYFLHPGYWTGKGGAKVKDGQMCGCTSSLPPSDHITSDDPDVLEEENTVKKQAREGLVDDNVAVSLRGLEKIYPGQKKGFCSICRRRSPPFHALKGLWVNFSKDQLFCLLGPNGAGKTTAINCLTGITPVTNGDALIYGNSIRSSIGMANIRKTIGVCPQFDILWDVLSGEEHLYLFASIKGLPPASIKSVVEKSLADVKLIEAAKIRASSYSGGMKRRLSVAIALIGEPMLVILDEPTTGMDPITRRHVWDIIEEAKKGRSIVLTTHSMEEADVLGDRIGIMAKGKLRCIGTSIRLKSRFGTGFVASISFSDTLNGTQTQNNSPLSTTTTSQHEDVKQFFKDHLGVLPKEENKSFLTYVIPHEKERLLKNFFAELQEKEREFGIADIQLGLTTLEEVFLNIAKQAEMESAIDEDRSATLTLNSRLQIQVPMGARFVGIPGTENEENPNGKMVEVYWEQDDTGALCISGQSEEMPIPPQIQSNPSRLATASRTLGRSGRIHGFIINPDETES